MNPYSAIIKGDYRFYNYSEDQMVSSPQFTPVALDNQVTQITFLGLKDTVSQSGTPGLFLCELIDGDTVTAEVPYGAFLELMTGQLAREAGVLKNRKYWFSVDNMFVYVDRGELILDTTGEIVKRKRKEYERKEFIKANLDELNPKVGDLFTLDNMRMTFVGNYYCQRPKGANGKLFKAKDTLAFIDEEGIPHLYIKNVLTRVTESLSSHKNLVSTDEFFKEIEKGSASYLKFLENKRGRSYIENEIASTVMCLSGLPKTQSEYLEFDFDSPSYYSSGATSDFIPMAEERDKAVK